MGLVSRLFEKKAAGFTLNAPAEGICVALHEVPDPTFGVNGKYFPAKNGNYFPAVSGK